jgi:hypothetical protein
MILQEHQSLFDSIVLAAAEASMEVTDIEKDEAIEYGREILSGWWSAGLVHVLPKRGVKAELTKSLSQHISMEHFA